MIDLESLLNAFYSGNLKPNEVQEIDLQLRLFKQQPGSYKQCEGLLFGSSSQNKHVTYYALSVYEEFVQKRFITIGLEEQISIKNSLLSLLQKYLYGVEVGSSAERSLKKLIKVIVDVAKVLWPNEFPDLLQIIHSLILSKETRISGLYFLKTMMEEFTSRKPHIDSRSRQILMQNVREFLPSVSALMKQILEGIYYESSGPNASSSNLHSRSLTERNYSGLSNNQVSPSVNALTLSLNTPVVTSVKSFEPDQSEAAVLAMEVIQVIFAFLNDSGTKQAIQNDVISLDLVEIILVYSKLNDSQNIRLGLISFTLLSDLLEKKNLRSLILQKDYSIHLLRHLTEILQHLTRVFNVSSNSLLSSNDLDEDYRMKLVEFIVSFIRNCYLSFSNDYVLSEQFFELLYRFTFNSSDIFWLNDTTDIWQEFLLEYYSDIDYNDVQAATNGGSTKDSKVLQIINLRSGLVELGKQFFRKCLFANNASELSRMASYDSLTEAQDQSEYESGSLVERFSSLVSKICEFFPNDFINDFYLALNARIVESDKLLEEFTYNSQGSLLKFAEFEHLALDAKTLLSLFAKLNNILTLNEGFSFSLLGVVVNLIKKLASSFSTFSHDNVFVHSYQNLIKECFLVISGFRQFLIKISNSQEFDQFMNHLSPALVHFVTIDDEVIPPAAVQCLVTICDSVKPRNIFKYNGISQFFAEIHGLTLGMKNTDIKKKCYYSVTCGILKCNPNATEESQKSLESFISGIVEPFKGLNISQENLFHLNIQLSHALVVLMSVIEAIQNERLALRNQCFSAILPVFQKLHQIYQSLFKLDVNSFMQVGDLNLHLLEFTTRFQDCFKSNLNSSNSTSWINEFTAIVFRYLQEKAPFLAAINSSMTTSIFEKYLEYLKVSLDNNNYEDICQIHFWCIENSSSSEFFDPIKLNLLEGIHFVILSKSKVISQSNPNLLIKCFKVYRDYLLSKQLDLYQKSISLLLELNTKILVFSKYFSVFYENFIPVLIGELVDQSFDLLKEESIKCIYQILSAKKDENGKAGFQAFYDEFLVFYLNSSFTNEGIKNKIFQGINKETDFPTFSDQLIRSIDDIIYYKKILNI